MQALGSFVLWGTQVAVAVWIILLLLRGRGHS